MVPSRFSLNYKKECLMRQSERVLYYDDFHKKVFSVDTSLRINEFALKNSIQRHPELVSPKESFGQGLLNL